MEDDLVGQSGRLRHKGTSMYERVLVPLDGSYVYLAEIERGCRRRACACTRLSPWVPQPTRILRPPGTPEPTPFAMATRGRSARGRSAVRGGGCAGSTDPDDGQQRSGTPARTS